VILRLLCRFERGTIDWSHRESSSTHRCGQFPSSVDKGMWRWGPCNIHDYKCVVLNGPFCCLQAAPVQRWLSENDAVLKQWFQNFVEATPPKGGVRGRTKSAPQEPSQRLFLKQWRSFLKAAGILNYQGLSTSAAATIFRVCSVFQVRC